LFGMFPSRGVWRRPGLNPVDLLVFAALLALLFGLLRLAPALNAPFLPKTAPPNAQMEITEWGRYGELFEYDAEDGQLVLGSDPEKVGV